MSLLLLEGFDDGLYAERWLGSPPAPTNDATNRQGLSMKFTSGDQKAMRTLGLGAHATITVGMWRVWGIARAIVTSDPDGVLFFGDSATIAHIWVGTSLTGELVVYRGTTELGRTSVVYPATGIGRYIEIQVVLHDTTGSVTIWSDGVQVLALTGVDTRNGGVDGTIDAIQFENASVTRRQDNRYDDIYITNGAGAAPYNGNLGDVVVATLVPNSNGAYSAFAGSDGNSVDNYLLVDELPAHDGDTTYVESTTDTERDSYGFTDLPYSTGTILGVIATAVARQLGAADNIQITTRIAGADYDGSSVPLPGAYDAEVTRIMELSPASAAAWTIAEINAAEFGLENVV